MAEVDPDQDAAMRRLRAAFGFVEVLRIIVHEQDQVDGELDEDPQQPPAAEGCASAAVAEVADRGYRTLRWSAPLVELTMDRS